MRRTVAIAAIAIAALLAVAIFIGTSRTDKTGESIEFPTRLQNRVVLNENGIGSVDFYPDGVTPERSVVFHEDGSKTTQWYRDTGTLKEIKTEMATEAGDWKLIRHSYMDVDGVTFITDREFYREGGLKKDLYVTADGTTARLEYYPSGTLKSDQILKKGPFHWSITAEKLYRDDSSLSSRLAVDKDGAKTRELFNASGTVTERTIINRWGNSLEKLVFGEDGISVKEKILQDNNETSLIIFREDGTRRLEVKYTGEVAKSTLWIDFFARDGVTKTHYQWWDYREEGYVLWLLKLFEGESQVANQIVFHRDGKTIASETIPLTDKGVNGERLVRTYREDGTLEKVRHLSAKSDTLKEELVEAVEGIIGSFPAHLAIMPEFTVPEQIIEYVPDTGD